MFRTILPAALLLGLAAVPALAQTAPDDPAVTRTLQQNQRAYVAPVVPPSQPQAAQMPAVRTSPAAASQAPVTGRRIAMAEPPRR